MYYKIVTDICILVRSSIHLLECATWYQLGPFLSIRTNSCVNIERKPRFKICHAAQLTQFPLQRKDWYSTYTFLFCFILDYWYDLQAAWCAVRRDCIHGRNWSWSFTIIIWILNLSDSPHRVVHKITGHVTHNVTMLFFNWPKMCWLQN